MSEHKKLRTIRNYFCFKDVFLEVTRFIYTFLCGNCTACNIGKTYIHFRVRIWERQGVVSTTSKSFKGTLSISVRDHILIRYHKGVYGNSEFVDTWPNRYLLESKERLFITWDKLSLNPSPSRGHWCLGT